jgi:ABC-type sugar transport system permease subunit
MIVTNFFQGLRNSLFGKTPTQRRETRTAWLFLAPNLLGFMLFTVFAVGMAFWLSFQEWDLFNQSNPVGLANYIRLFTGDPDFMRALYNTVYFVIGVVPVGAVLSLILALLVNQKIKGVSLFRTALYVPVVTPTIAVGLIWVWLYNSDFGLINSFLSQLGFSQTPNWLTSSTWSKPAIVLMNIWQNAGYYMVIYLAALQNIPDQLYEAAKIDGATRWQQFSRITLPLLSPTTFLVFVMKTMGAFKIFEAAYIMTEGGPGGSTETIVYYIYKNGFEWFRMGYAAAIAWVLFAIIFLCTLFQFKIQKTWVYYE